MGGGQRWMGGPKTPMRKHNLTSGDKGTPLSFFYVSLAPSLPSSLLPSFSPFRCIPLAKVRKLEENQSVIQGQQESSQDPHVCTVRVSKSSHWLRIILSLPCSCSDGTQGPMPATSITQFYTSPCVLSWYLTTVHAKMEPGDASCMLYSVQVMISSGSSSNTDHFFLVTNTEVLSSKV